MSMIDYTVKEKIILQMDLMGYSFSPTTLKESYELMFKLLNNIKSSEFSEKENSLLEMTSLEAITKINSVEESWILMIKYFNKLEDENVG